MRLGLGVILGVSMVLAAGCGKEAEESSRVGGEKDVVRITASEYSYSMPRTAVGGVVTFELNNLGAQPHEFSMARVGSGKTVEDLAKALKSGKDLSKLPWIHPYPGVPLMSPEETIRITREMEDEGTYVVFCTLPSGVGKPHFDLGMIHILDIARVSGGSLPAADATIEATDEGLEGPSLEAGQQMLELKNAGSKEHEFWLWAFHPGKTNEDVDAWFEGGMPGAAPATFLGGVEAIAPGTSVFLELDLEEGTTYTVQDLDDGLRVDLPVR